MKENILKIIRSKIGLIWIISGILIIVLPSYYFMEADLIIGNLWYSFYMWEVILTILIALLFGIFIWSTLYKIHYFSLKKSGLGFLWGFLGILVAGCPACSITLASYIGLAGIISIFPFYGLELKIASLLFLMYASYVTIRDLQICKIKK